MLFGRDDECRNVIEAAGALVIVAGDTGMGKTALLSAAQDRTEGVSPPPVSVRASPGSLQRALLQSISLGIEAVQSEEGVRDRCARLAAAVMKRMEERGLSDLAAAVGSAIKHQVDRYLGPDVARGVGRVATAIAESHEEDLGRRIAADGDADVVEVVLAFASELRAMAGEDVTLALDDVHKLDVDDHRRLLDIVQTAPAGIHIRAAFTDTPSAVGRLFEFRRSGAEVVKLRCLDQRDVATWAEHDGIPEGVVELVTKVTGAVPFHVNDAFTLLRHFPDYDLSRLAGDELVKLRTREAWNALDPSDRAATSLLVSLTDVASAQRTAHLLDFTEEEWFILRERLVDVGLFLADSNWFHELRRRCLLEDVLATDQVATCQRRIVERSVAMIESSQASGIDLLDCIRDLSALAAASRVVLAGRPGVNAVLDCSSDELRTLVAIIEMSELKAGVSGDRTTHEIVMARMVAEHLSGLEPRVDFVPSFPRLRDAGLIGMVEGENDLAVWPLFPSNEAWWLIQGRSAFEIGHWPIRGLGTAIFQGALRPSLAAFRTATYGLGRVDIATLADASGRRLAMRRDDTISLRDGSPSLAVRGRFASDVPFHAVVAYDRIHDRNEAAAQISLRAVTDLLGSPFEVDEVLSFPSCVLPLNRFIAAYEAVARAEPSGSSRPTVDIAEGARRIKALHDIVRRHATPQEQDILGVDQPLGIRYLGFDAGYIFVEITGDDTVQESSPEILSWPQTAEEWLSLDQRLNLRLGQRRKRLIQGGGSRFIEDPLRGLTTDLKDKADRYNRAQMRVQIDYTLEALAPLLVAAFNERTLIEHEIATEVFRQYYQPKTLYVLLDIQEPEGNWVPGSQDQLECWTSLAGADGPQLHLAEGRSSQWSPYGPDPTEFRAAFRSDPPADPGWHAGRCWDWISDMLGYSSGDLWLHWPSHERLFAGDHEDVT